MMNQGGGGGARGAMNFGRNKARAANKEDIKKLVKHKNGENNNFTEDKVYFNSKVPLAYHYITERCEVKYT